MPYNEADTRAKLIDPALYGVGWSEEWIRREETDGAIQLTGSDRGGDENASTMFSTCSKNGVLFPIALIEAKAEDQSPSTGLEQVKEYRRRWNVPFAFSANGHHSSNTTS